MCAGEKPLVRSYVYMTSGRLVLLGRSGLRDLTMPVLRNNKWEKACQYFVLEGSTKVEAFIHGFPLTVARQTRESCRQRSYELFKRPEIKARVAELMVEKAAVAKKEFGVDAAYVLQRIVEVDRMDISDILTEAEELRPVAEWPQVWRQFISQFEIEELHAGHGIDRLQIGLLKKLKWPDKLANLKLMGTHVDVSAFKHVQELQGAGGGPVKIISKEMTAQEAAEAYAGTLHDK